VCKLIFLVPYRFNTEMITMVNAQEKQPFERIEVTRQQALEFFAENPFKVICC
jgi:threonyl-tRNA synthetase